MVASLGGPADFVERPAQYLAHAVVVQDVPAPASGRVISIDTRAVGLAVVALGGGRTSPEQAIDPAVGFDRLVPRGAAIRLGDPLARVHAANSARAAEATAALQAAFTIGEAGEPPPPLVERIG
jgi:thymidine phosphorylase